MARRDLHGRVGGARGMHRVMIKEGESVGLGGYVRWRGSTPGWNHASSSVVRICSSVMIVVDLLVRDGLHFASGSGRV